jgi:predicted phosphoribosyltransferase
VDEVVVVHVDEQFLAIGAFYINFQQTTDEEVLLALK